MQQRSWVDAAPSAVTGGYIGGHRGSGALRYAAAPYRGSAEREANRIERRGTSVSFRIYHFHIDQRHIRSIGVQATGAGMQGEPESSGRPRCAQLGFNNLLAVRIETDRLKRPGLVRNIVEAEQESAR